MKHKRTSRLFSALLALVMVVSLLPVSVFAQTPEAETPTAITATLADTPHMRDGVLIAQQGDTYHLHAVDQNGRETPVTWSCPRYMNSVSLDKDTGAFTIVKGLYGGDSTSYYTFTATSTLDPSVTGEVSVKAAGYRFSEEMRNKRESFAQDGQEEQIVSLRGGVDGHTTWSYDKEAIQAFASVVQDPGKADEIRFRFSRPGTVQVSFALDFDETMTDSATITMGGVAVVDSTGAAQKTHLSFDEGTGTSAQLTAYCEEGHDITAWESENDHIVTVDPTGKITATGIGTAQITAVDDQGKKGGIRVVVSSENTPLFERFEWDPWIFQWGQWEEGETFQPLKKEYALTLTGSSTNQMTIRPETTYNDEKFQAVAAYTDRFGTPQTVEIRSGEASVLKDIPFGTSDVVVTLSERGHADHATRYIFHVTRPYDTSDGIASGGIRLVPEGRPLSALRYLKQPEGTMFRADEAGTAGTSTGVMDRIRNYRTYLLEGTKAFQLELAGKTEYVHIRYKAGDADSWTEMTPESKRTAAVAVPDGGAAQVTFQTISDKVYRENTAAGKDPFDGAARTFHVWVEAVEGKSGDVQILTAQSDRGDWYPAFRPDHYSYNLVEKADEAAAKVTFTAPETAQVKSGKEPLAKDDAGKYTVQVDGPVEITLESADGKISNTYRFTRVQRSDQYDVPDRVTDYLCINSQYTNAGNFGGEPERTLSGSLKSLGNFGGYITYYYEEPLQNNPNNPYGVDFFAYGNANVESGGSGYGFFEPGQVWVSETGEDWYALAGSEHYEKDTIWDYTVTYTEHQGRTAWSDNYGHTEADAAGTAQWIDPAKYPLHTFAGESVTLRGILLPAGDDGTIVGNGKSHANHVAWGYADAFANGKLGEAVNPYQENSDMARQKPINGFDLAWAVDAAGNPVAVDNVHYVKVVTASNLWHSSFKEKSTEVSYVMRADAKDAPVGKTAAPTGVTVSDGARSKTMALSDTKQVYELNVGDMKYVSLQVNGTAENDNIYVNDVRLAPGQAAEGIKVTREGGETLVRIIVQSGEKEPVLYLLKLTGTAQESTELLGGVKVTVDGIARPAETSDGQTYTMTVGHRIDAVGLVPVKDPATTYTVNGEAPKDSYPLKYGSNEFVVRAISGTEEQTVRLIVVRENAPETSDRTITVHFALYGDHKHGDTGECHLYGDGAEDLQLWLPAAEITVPENAVVLDVFEKALGEQFAYVNAGGNYISSIHGLAEFDNGPNSGWMYLVNGVYAAFGVAEQEVHDGDTIIFHYTDDYTKEEQLSGENKEKVAAVEALIDAIVLPVTLESETAITAARTAYDALPAALQVRVANYDKLRRSETALAELKATESDKKAAKEVEEQIAAIGPVTLASAEQIASARAAYEALTATQKQLVGNVAQLAAAESKLQQLKNGPVEAIYKTVGEHLESLAAAQVPDVASVGGEWLVLGLARSGRAVPTPYYERVLAYVQANINEAQQLHRAKATENARVILALTALGRDVTDVGGHDLLQGLTDMSYLNKQGLNGPVWALIAFDAHGYAIPANPTAKEQVTRETLVERILAAQNPDGGWSLSEGDRSDPDMTAMALQALAPYAATQERCGAAVEKALVWLSHVQTEKGAFGAQQPNGTVTESSESTAQVVVALCALGIDPMNDARFVKNGLSVVDALCSFAVENGFAHQAGEGYDQMATEQAYYALAAYFRLREGKTALYDMSDVTIGAGTEPALPETPAAPDAADGTPSTGDERPVERYAVVAGATVLAAALLFVQQRKRRTDR